MYNLQSILRIYHYSLDTINITSSDKIFLILLRACGNINLLFFF